MDKREIYIFGAGGHGAVVADLASILGYQIAGIIDDNEKALGKKLLDWNVIGDRRSIPDGVAVALAVGDNLTRYELLSYAEIHNWSLPVLVHPAAAVSPNTEIGRGTVVLAQAAVNARAIVGDACILNTACSVDHDAIVGSAAHVCPGTRLAGGVRVGDMAMIGIGSSVKQMVKIGSRTTLGAGSVVVRDIPDGCLAYGNPARVIKKHSYKKQSFIRRVRELYASLLDH